MPQTIADWLILSGVLMWDGIIMLFIWRHSQPSWRRKPRVPKAVKGRITYDRDEYGGII